MATDIIHLNCRRLDAYRGNYDAFEQARSERLLNQQREYESQKAEREHVQVGEIRELFICFCYIHDMIAFWLSVNSTISHSYL